MSQSMLTSPDRLRKIDQLRERNIATYLALPQLVAVGDQSSGKSSLLENLTGIPFPRGQELCTRYATQITHRRDVANRITISIIPGPTASLEHKEKLQSFTREVETTDQLHAEFPDILNKVNTLMDIKTPRNPGGTRTFSEDVLKIERCGPEEDYLTVIDVPGIFRITTQGVTTDQDRLLVERMVKNYIRDNRTVILAVLPCNVDIATQEILAFAEKADPTGERTLGILTKPDLLKERSAKSVVCDLVLGKRRPLTLGYYVVRSRGGDEEDSNGDIDLLHGEDMFKEEPWTSLPGNKIADKAFPKLRSETRRKLNEKQEELMSLGPPRQTERQQQQFLVDVASKFQSIVRASLDADYSTHESFADGDLRLITKVVNTSEDFASDFEACAHTYSFEGEPPKSLQTMPSPPLFSDGEYDDQDEEAKISKKSCNIFDLNLYPDLEGLLSQGCTSHQPAEGIMPWITQIHLRSRGAELGTFGPHILSSAFQEQSIYWKKMARQYLSKVIFCVHKFILRALENVCSDTRVLEELTSGLMAELLTKYDSSMNQAIHLVDIERHKKPYTLNHYFNENLQNARNRRTLKALKEKVWKENETKRNVVDVNDIPSLIQNRSNMEHTTEEIHDILQAYYKVARKRFVDNVYHQAVDHCLLSGPSNPLGLFCEQWVLDLSDERLRSIAGETRVIQERRQNLQTALQDLAQALEILG
ncbi:dynamin family protein [Fusarium langsethiae]|uniref:Dynamin family protein n=1 Tax=Fusarium langsethiae TaxID=179993 RepID=A0A0M9EMQ7_FUSLA|nr:dynamin family protein [Fusarium langsethiae]